MNSKSSINITSKESKFERISVELKSNFEKKFEKNKDKWGKFLTRENNRLRLTKEGYAFADAVAVDFLL